MVSATTGPRGADDVSHMILKNKKKIKDFEDAKPLSQIGAEDSYQ